MTELSAEALTAGYGRQQILFGVDVRLLARGVTCVFGPNGSGKSTLLKTLAGVVPAWGGRVLLDGEDVTRLPAHMRLRRGVATCSQGGGIFPHLTVSENLWMGAFTVADRVEVAARMRRVLGQFPDLEPKLQRPAGTLSGGQQMMLSLGRALMAQPRALLLDEPSAGLSPKLVADTFRHVHALAELGTPILLVEQNVRQALQIADYVYILAQGQVRFSGTPGQVRADAALMDLYLGLAESVEGDANPIGGGNHARVG